MPTLIEGVVSDFAQPGDKSDRYELTLGDMEEFAEKLKNMRLVYDHEHPAHSTKDHKIAKEMSVGKIVDAYIDEDECLRVRAELDDDEAGKQTREEIESNFLTGFSLGLMNSMSTENGVSKFNKDLVELSITPIPEFAATSFVRVVDAGAESAPVHCKLTEFGELTAEHRGQVVAITASSGKRDAQLDRRARELLVRLKRAKYQKPQAQAQSVVSASSATGGAKVSNARNLNSQQSARQSGTSSQNQTMTSNGQFALPQASGTSAQLEAHIEGQRARRDAMAETAMMNGNTFTQQPPRSGIAPVHIHQYMDGRRSFRPQQRQPQQQQQRRRQQQQQQPPQDYDDQMYDENIVDDVDAGGGYNQFDEMDNDYDDEPLQQQAPPPRQQPQGRRGQPYARPQQQQRRQRPQKANTYDDAPPPTPDVADEVQAQRDNEANQGGTKNANELRRIEKKRLKDFQMAGGKLTKKQAEFLKSSSNNDGDDTPDLAQTEKDEFEVFKEFRQLKSGNKRKQQALPPQKKASAAAPASDNMFLDDNEDTGDNNQEGDDDDEVETAEAKLRRENAALRAKLAAKGDAKGDATKARVQSIKSKLNKPSTDIVDDGDDNNGGDGFFGDEAEKDEFADGVDLSTLNETLQIDEHGESKFKEEFNARLDEMKAKRKALLALSQKLVTAKSENKDKLAAELFNKKKKLESDFQREKTKLIDDAREFTSRINTASGKTTDARTLDLFGSLKTKRGLITDRELDTVGSLVEISASSGESFGKTFTAVNERFKKEQMERENAVFRAKEAERLAGRSADTAAAARMVLGNDPVARSAKPAPKAKGEAAFFVPRPGREAVLASENYAGYDPKTMLPAGKAASQFTQRDITGLPIQVLDDSKEPAKDVIRQKKPKSYIPQIPHGVMHVQPKKGLWRTGNDDLIQQISASRADSGSLQFTRMVRNQPPGAVLSPDGQFYSLPDPDTKGQ